MDDKSQKTVIYLWSLTTIIFLLIYKNIVIGFGASLYQTLLNMVLILMLMLACSLKRQSFFAKFIQFFIALFIILYQWLDTCIFLALDNRLTFTNLYQHYYEVGAAPYFLTTKVVVFTFITLALMICFRKRTLKIAVDQSFTNYFSIQMVVILVAAQFLINKIGGEHTPAIVLDNTSMFAPHEVSNKSLDYIRSTYADLAARAERIFDGSDINASVETNAQKPNIIILLSESLSGVDSHYAKGLFNRLPKIDKIQQDGLTFSHAVSNGKNSWPGLAAILLGILPIQTSGYEDMYRQDSPAAFPENNLITYAKKAGYKTIVISPITPSAWLTPWFKQVGFDQVYDTDSDVFSSAPRYTWNSPSDQAMYELTNQLITQEKGPYLILIETASLHQPYILPDSSAAIPGASDLLNLINYVDITTYQFYQQLKQKDFFNNGVMLLIGDHRRFEEFEPEELGDGGTAVWHERIVCSFIGKNIPSHVISDIAISSVDMNTLLHYLIQGKSLDNDTLLSATLGSRLGIGEPFSASLGDESNGENGNYLIRSQNLRPLFISVYGNIPFDQIPDDYHKKASAYLAINAENIQSREKKESGQ